MKKHIVIFILIVNISCNAQKNNSKPNNDPMKYYNNEQYKDWIIDPRYVSSQSDTDKYLMKENERVRIWTDDETIHVEKTNIVNPYKITYVYYLQTNLILGYYKNFYNLIYGIDKAYDKTGKLIKENDWDKSYKFSIKDLIQKFEQEYNVDLESQTSVSKIYRYKNIKI